MSLSGITKTKAERVVGIDCSTNSLAFAVFDGTTPVFCGEINFRGSDIYEKLNDARCKTQALVDSGVLCGDYIAMEAAIGGKSNQTTIKLSYVYGAVLSVLMQTKAKVTTVYPITWQTHIGNPLLKKSEKEALKTENPGRSASWYQNAGRQLRKHRTLDFAKQYFSIPTDSDNCGDAVGVARYAVDVLTRV